MSRSARHRGHAPPPQFEPNIPPATQPLRRNIPPEHRQPKQPGTGSASLNPVAVTVRRRSRWRTRSGRIRRDWELMFEPTTAPTLDPLTGSTQTTNPLAGHMVAFHTADAAIAFAKRKGWEVRLIGRDYSEESLPERDAPGGKRACPIDETIRQSFPASDPPSWTLGRSR